MPGAFTHQAAMEQCQELLLAARYPVYVGSRIDVVEPDHETDHWYDLKTDSGDILDMIEKYYEITRGIFIECNKDTKRLHIPFFSRTVRYLCHYATDAHMVSHISSELRSRRAWVDFFGDLVLDKRAYPTSLTTYYDKYQLKSALNFSMQSVYETYRDKCLRWSFLFSSDLSGMVRGAVRSGAEFAASWVQLAWDNS